MTMSKAGSSHIEAAFQVKERAGSAARRRGGEVHSEPLGTDERGEQVDGDRSGHDDSQPKHGASPSDAFAAVDEGKTHG